MTHSRITPVLLVAALLAASCQQAPSDRTSRLLTMAGEEAASIPSKLDRFTRQLNIADIQLRQQRQADAAKTLALARDTLTAAAKGDFDDLRRIAAWTSISQLARRAGDRDLALDSSDKALAALNDVQPAAERPQYVLSLAGELADLRGKEAAIELVNSGGTWAAEIVEPNTRRTALTAFADRLLSYEAYENARTLLRRDPDPVWRTDTFLALANAAPREYLLQAEMDTPRSAGGRGGGAGGGNVYFQQITPAAKPFGKDVRYESNFQQGAAGR